MSNEKMKRQSNEDFLQKAARANISLHLKQLHPLSSVTIDAQDDSHILVTPQSHVPICYETPLGKGKRSLWISAMFVFLFPQ